jgi:endo-1,4-beta-xylanase
MSLCSGSKGSLQKHLVLIVYGVLAVALLCAGRLSTQTVATYNFDDGAADGWASFNGATTPVASNAAAYTGGSSLLTTTGSTGAGGPSISLNGVLLPGAQYAITAYVMLTNGESAANANFTVRRSDSSCSGENCYDTIGSYTVPVSSSGWAQIGGTYTVSPTETGLTLYAQLVGATSAQSFYLDDIVITETAPPPGGTPVATYTFADGGLDGWAPFGSATLTNAPPPVPDSIVGSNSLEVTNRTAG